MNPWAIVNEKIRTVPDLWWVAYTRDELLGPADAAFLRQVSDEMEVAFRRSVFAGQVTRSVRQLLAAPPTMLAMLLAWRWAQYLDGVALERDVKEVESRERAFNAVMVVAMQLGLTHDSWHAETAGVIVAAQDAWRMASADEKGATE